MTGRHSDPVLLRTGVAIALRAIAAMVDGNTDPRAAMEWCLKVGYLQYVDRETLGLTPDGERIVYAYWQSMREERGWGERHTLTLPDGVNVTPTIEDAARLAARIDIEHLTKGVAPHAGVDTVAILTGQADPIDPDDAADVGIGMREPPAGTPDTDRNEEAA